MAKRIIVIGGLAAGPSAASKAVRTSPDVEVILFEQGEQVSYGICEIPYYISGEVEQSGLVAYTPESLRDKKGVDARILHRVEDIFPTKRTVAVRDLKTGSLKQEKYDRLIIATGSKAKKLGVAGEDARNVFNVKSLDDGLHIKQFIEREEPKSAVIVGGGYIGMEMADALVSLGLAVTMLHRHSLPLSGMERNAREKVREQLEKNGVNFVGQATVEGFVTNGHQRVTHVVASSGSFESDLVIICIGVEPNTALAKKAGISMGGNGGVLTDQRQQTNLDSVFAAGDCCEVRNMVNNKSMLIPLATIASKMGWVAGENAAGGTAMFRGAIRSIAVRIFGMEVMQVGISGEEARASGFDVVTETISAWSRVGVMPGASKIVITTIADKKSKRLLGANLYGTEGAVHRGNTLAVAIQHRIPVDEIQQWDLAYTPPFTPLWDPLLVVANALRKKL